MVFLATVNILIIPLTIQIITVLLAREPAHAFLGKLVGRLTQENEYAKKAAIKLQPAVLDKLQVIGVWDV